MGVARENLLCFKHEHGHVHAQEPCWRNNFSVARLSFSLHAHHKTNLQYHLQFQIQIPGKFSVDLKNNTLLEIRLFFVQELTPNTCYHFQLKNGRHI